MVLKYFLIIFSFEFSLSLHTISMMEELEKAHIYYENNIKYKYIVIRKSENSVLNYSSSKTINTAMFQFPCVLK